MRFNIISIFLTNDVLTSIDSSWFGGAAILFEACRLFCHPNRNKHGYERCHHRSDNNPGSATGAQSRAAATASVIAPLVIAPLRWDVNDTRGRSRQVDSAVKGQVAHVDNLERIRWEVGH
jgi:hypothetical protein